MERILVGIDGSPAAHGALTWAFDIARRVGAELTAARVFAPDRAEGSLASDRLLREALRKQLDEQCRALAGGGVRHETIVLEGDATRALMDAAGQRRADLLAVGARGAGGFLHLHVGSVANHLIHHASIPLAVVPPTGTHPTSHLVIGVDGSPASGIAVTFGADLASALSIGATAVYAHEPIAVWHSDDDERSWRQRSEAELREWCLPLEKQGVPFDLDVDQDIHPVAAITRALAAHHGAVACVGARGQGGFEGLRLGRVPLQLVHHAGTTVLVIPTAASRGEADTSQVGASSP